MASGRADLRLTPSHDSLLACDWSPDGGRIVTGGADRTVRIFNMATGAETVRAAAHTDWVLGVAFVADGQRVVSGGRDRTLRLLEAGDGRMLDVLNKDTEPVVRMVRVPGAERVIFAGADARARIYKTETRPPNTDPGKDPNFVREFDAFGDGMTAIGVSADGSRVAVAGMSPDEMRVHESASGKRVATFKELGGPVFGLAFDPAGERVAAAGFDGQVRVFEIKSGKLLTNFCPVEITGRVAKGK